MKYKRIIRVLISSILFSAILSIPAMAIDDQNLVNSNDTKVVIEKDAENIPQEIIAELLKENQEADKITIYEYSDITESSDAAQKEETDNVSRTPFSYNPPAYTYGPVSTSYYNVSRNVVFDDQFKFSVARGQTTTISYTIEGTVKGSISGVPFNKSTIGAEVTIRGSYTSGTTYSGPPEGTRYNSRQFRMKFFGETGSYTQTRPIYFLNGQGSIINTGSESKNGTYRKPTHYAKYSIDSYQY